MIATEDHCETHLITTLNTSSRVNLTIGEHWFQLTVWKVWWKGCMFWGSVSLTAEQTRGELLPALLTFGKNNTRKHSGASILVFFSSWSLERDCVVPSLRKTPTRTQYTADFPKNRHGTKCDFGVFPQATQPKTCCWGARKKKYT